MKKIKIIESKYNNENNTAICTIETDVGYFKGESNLNIDKLDNPSMFLQSDIARIRAIQTYIDYLLDKDFQEVIPLKKYLDNEIDKRKKKKYEKQFQRKKERIERNQKKKQELEQRINDLIIQRKVFLQNIKDKKEGK